MDISEALLAWKRCAARFAVLISDNFAFGSEACQWVWFVLYRHSPPSSQHQQRLLMLSLIVFVRFFLVKTIPIPWRQSKTWTGPHNEIKSKQPQKRCMDSRNGSCSLGKNPWGTGHCTLFLFRHPTDKIDDELDLQLGVWIASMHHQLSRIMMADAETLASNPQSQN